MIDLMKVYEPIEDHCAPFEEELLRDPTSFKTWISYLDQDFLMVKEPSSMTIKQLVESTRPKFLLFERALLLFTGSFKLWKRYLDERTELVDYILQQLRNIDFEGEESSLRLAANEISLTNSAFERACALIPRLPRLWIDYANFAIKQQRILLACSVLDRALRNLPFSLHERIWKVYMSFVKHFQNIHSDLALSIRSRFWSVAANKSDLSTALEYVDFLQSASFPQKAASLLIELIEDEKKVIEITGRERYEAYVEKYLTLLQNSGKLANGQEFESYLETLINETLKGERGKFWIAQSMWELKKGDIDKARSVFNNALNSAQGAKEFSLIFDAFTKMEESIIAALASKAKKQKTRSKTKSEDDLAHIDELIKQFQDLLEKRDVLLARSIIRSDPMNAQSWLTLLSLSNEKLVVAGLKKEDLYEEALSTLCKSTKPVENLAEVWISFANYLINSGSEWKSVLEDALKWEQLFPRDQQEYFWTSWADLVSSEVGLEASLDILGRALSRVSLRKSRIIWEKYIDFEETGGRLAATISAYDRAIEAGVASAQIFMNYALLLEENGKIEESFKVYQRGIVMFGYPVSFELWNTFLPKYVEYYQEKSGGVERIRELYEQSLVGCPSNLSRELYLQYASFEEKNGLGRNCLGVLRRGLKAIDNKLINGYIEVLLDKSRDIFGVSSQRQVFEDAISLVTDQEVFVDLSLRFASLEISLGEHERARSIFNYCASSSDPRKFPKLWTQWQEFETSFGTEITFRDMLRVKRSVSAKFAPSITFVKETDPDILHSTLPDE